MQTICDGNWEVRTRCRLSPALERDHEHFEAPRHAVVCHVSNENLKHVLHTKAHLKDELYVLMRTWFSSVFFTCRVLQLQPRPRRVRAWREVRPCRGY